MNNIESKQCSECKQWKSLSCFHKHTLSQDGFVSKCKECTPKRGRPAGYVMNKKSKKIISKKLKNRTLKKKHKERISKSMLGNNNRTTIKGFGDIEFRKRPTSYSVYKTRLDWCEEIRRSPENSKILEVRCAYCNKWFVPTSSQVITRINALYGTTTGECRFYCSEGCKKACPTYNTISKPKTFKKATSCEVTSTLRWLVLERDNYTCQKCGATTETAQLHVHNNNQNKIQTKDPDSCITLCKDCHGKDHQ